MMHTLIKKIIKNLMIHFHIFKMDCGESRIRTCEGETNGFTVRPRWPLEYLPA